MAGPTSPPGLSTVMASVPFWSVPSTLPQVTTALRDTESYAASIAPE